MYPTSCGACGAACSDDHVETQTCEQGACGGVCETGYGDCNGDMRADGCETDLRTSLEHCGACGNACKDLEGCYRGMCAPELVPVQGGYYIDATEVTQRQYQGFLATNPTTEGLPYACAFDTDLKPNGICMNLDPYCHECSHPDAWQLCERCPNAPQTCVDWCDA